MQSLFQLPKLYPLTTQAGSWTATSKATRHGGKQFLRAAASLFDSIKLGFRCWCVCFGWSKQLCIIGFFWMYLAFSVIPMPFRLSNRSQRGNHEIGLLEYQQGSKIMMVSSGFLFFHKGANKPTNDQQTTNIQLPQCSKYEQFLGCPILGALAAVWLSGYISIMWAEEPVWKGNNPS